MPIPSDEQEFKKKILGSLEYFEPAVLDKSLIKEAFKKPDTVIYVFCKRCGVLHEVNRSQAEALFGNAKLFIPDTIRKEEYLEINNCMHCESEEKFAVELKRI
jgi:hypothetical protein